MLLLVTMKSTILATCDGGGKPDLFSGAKRYCAPCPVLIFQKLKHTESDKLQVQIQAYLDNVFDVGALLEDAETKNAALERVEELEENISHVSIGALKCRRWGVFLEAGFYLVIRLFIWASKCDYKCTLFRLYPLLPVKLLVFYYFYCYLEKKTHTLLKYKERLIYLDNWFPCDLIFLVQSAVLCLLLSWQCHGQRACKTSLNRHFNITRN